MTGGVTWAAMTWRSPSIGLIRAEHDPATSPDFEGGLANRPRAT
jgi:hypothetical protein